MVLVRGLGVPQAVYAKASSSADGQAWLARLPGLVERVARNWGLDVQRVLDHSGAMSWVALVEGGESKAVLKVSIPHDEARHEADALAAFGGDGAVALHNVLRDGSRDDGFVLLLDRCEPGAQLLAHVSDDDEHLRILAAVMQRIYGVGPQPEPPSIDWLTLQSAHGAKNPRSWMRRSCDARSM
jgi:streptomycin 6-kinase